MKIDIQRGYRIQVFGLGGLVGIVKRMQGALSVSAERAVSREMSRQCKAVLDGLVAGDGRWVGWALHTVGPQSLYTVIRRGVEATLAGSGPSTSQCGLGHLGCRARIYPDKDCLLIALDGPALNGADIHDPLGIEEILWSIPGLEEFSYRSGEPKSDATSDAEWAARGEAWLDALMGARNGRGIVLDASLIDPANITIPAPEALETGHPAAYLTLPIQAVLDDLGLGKPISIEAAALDGIVEHERAALRKALP